MTQYETYEDAKINNPRSEICKLICGGFVTDESIRAYNFGRYSFVYCKREDYCISELDLINLGFKVRSGDVVIMPNGLVKRVQETNVDPSKPSNTYILKSRDIEQSKLKRSIGEAK